MRQILTSTNKPEIFDTLSEKFGVSWDNVIIAYNGTIYAKKPLEPQKIVHESVHLDEQERIGNEAWWRLFLENEQFRLDQEVLAHKAEADFIRKHIKDRNHRWIFLNEIAKSLAGPTYGNICTLKEAWKLIS